MTNLQHLHTQSIENLYKVKLFIRNGFEVLSHCLYMLLQALPKRCWFLIDRVYMQVMLN